MGNKSSGSAKGNGGGKSGGQTAVPKAVRDQNSQQTNGNWGTPGTNIHWDKAQGSTGSQIAQNQQAAKPK